MHKCNLSTNPLTFLETDACGPENRTLNEFSGKIVPRGGTRVENPCQVVYQEDYRKSGLDPGRVYPMRTGKPPHYFHLCLQLYADMNWDAVFRALSTQKLNAHRDIDTE